MKKTIIILSAITLFTGSLFAQSFVFIKDGERLPNNTEITVTEVKIDEDWGGSPVIKAGVFLENLTDNTIPAILAQIVIESDKIGTLEVCFYNCFMPTIEDAEWSVLVAPGLYDTEDKFKINYYPEEGEYTSVKVKYEIYPESDTDDKTSVIINFVYSESGICKTNLNETISVYDQNGKTCFQFNQLLPNTQLVIYNITGKEIGQYEINSRMFVLPEILRKGIYIYAVKEKGRVIYTGKYIQK